MATNSGLRILLYRIRGQLLKHPVLTRGTGVPVEESAHFSELKELDEMSLRLSLIFRELKGKSSLLNVRERNLWKVPRKDRYRARTSVRTQQAEVTEVLNLAREIQLLVEDLLRKSGLIGEGELAQGIADLIEQLYDQAHAHGEVKNMPDGLHYTSPASGEFGGTVEGVMLYVFVALRALVYAAKRAGKGQNIRT